MCIDLLKYIISLSKMLLKMKLKSNFSQSVNVNKNLSEF